MCSNNLILKQINSVTILKKVYVPYKDYFFFGGGGWYTVENQMRQIHTSMLNTHTLTLTLTHTHTPFTKRQTDICPVILQEDSETINIFHVYDISNITC